MKIVNGVYTSAKIFTETIEAYAVAQIQMLCDQEAFAGCTIRVMPDVHPGKVGTIGFTSTVGRKVLPNVVGIDVGCGVTLAKLKGKKTEFQKLDKVIREGVPSGAQIRREPHRFIQEFDFLKLNCVEHVNIEKTKQSLGTLGGGNHFIELDKDGEGSLYAAVHSGSIQWVCSSPYRPTHKRKNWFVDVSVIPEAEGAAKSYKEQEIRFERFHCGGKGGQNVNKVETGVRLIHIPTGITVTSTSERSQYANKRDALSKLNVILGQMELEEKKKQTNSAWQEHTKIVRGNPVRVYEGMDFKRKI